MKRLKMAAACLALLALVACTDSRDAESDASHPVQTAPIAEAELGIPFYPGAQRQDEFGVQITLPSPSPKMQQVVLYTSDAQPDVASFYRKALAGMETGTVKLSEEPSSMGDGPAFKLSEEGSPRVIVNISPANAKNPEAPAGVQAVVLTRFIPSTPNP
jgi:hypothetical protein